MLKLSIFLFVVISVACASTILRRNKRVIGGRPADISEYPYQVSVIVNKMHICGGAIISPNFVITAAHCVDGELETDVDVQAGVTTIDVKEDDIAAQEGATYKVERIYIHSKFSLWNYDYDIAILKLVKKLPQNENINSIALPKETDNVPVGEEATITGWGAIVEKESGLSTQLLTTEVLVIPIEECLKDYPYDEITQTVICAGKGGHDSCLGDSGGPLAVDNILFGVVSWGYACGEVNRPGIYTSIIQVRDFIKDITGI